MCRGLQLLAGCVSPARRRSWFGMYSDTDLARARQEDAAEASQRWHEERARGAL